MSSENSTCAGCHVNFSWLKPWFAAQDNLRPICENMPLPSYMAMTTPGLTNEEKLILAYLAFAWDEYVKLPEKCPDDNEEFSRAVHEVQRLIAIRVARRVDPDVWRQGE